MNGEFDFESGESLKSTSWMDGCQMHGWMDALHCNALRRHAAKSTRFKILDTRSHLLLSLGSPLEVLWKST